MPELTQRLLPHDIDERMANALTAEFLGSLLLIFMQGINSAHAYSPLSGAFGVAFSYGVLVAITRRVSGGHLNPAVSVAAAIAGHAHWVKALLYVLVQVLGGVVGAMLQAALVPGLHLGGHDGPGCFSSHGLSLGQLFGWEAVATFVLVAVYFSCISTADEQATTGALVLGFALLALTLTGGDYSGALANPIRALAPALVYLCSWRRLWMYLLAQVVGAALAASLGVMMYGVGEEEYSDITETGSAGIMPRSGGGAASQQAGSMVQRGIESTREALLGGRGEQEGGERIQEPPRPENV